MKKIAFITTRYGLEVNGGGEVHCRMLAERMTPYYQVEVLTSTIRNFGDPALDYPQGTKTENGVIVRRFLPQPVDGANYGLYRRQSKWARRIRHYLHKLGILKILSSVHPVWRMGQKRERLYFESQEGHTPSLLRYIEANKQEYAALVFMNYYFSQAVLGPVIAPEKSLLIPMAHPDKAIYYSMNASMFTQVRHIAFNTSAEQKLCRSIFGRRLAPASILGTGIELAQPAPWEEVRAKYGLPERYVLYLGRVTPPKIDKLLPYFERYKHRYGTDVTLVLTGGVDPLIQPSANPDVLFTGFVSDEEKCAIIRHATVMVNPSPLESLSLLLLEGLTNGVPMLVNGKSEVMKDHCRLSGAALWYDNGKEFRRKLHRLLTDERLQEEMRGKGPAYVREHYDWEQIIGKLRRLIESI